MMMHHLGEIAIRLQARIADLTRHERPLWSKYERLYDEEKAYACAVCNTGVDDDNMVACDGCNRFYHTTKCTALKGKVPKGDWYCSSCRKGGAKRNQADASTIMKTIANSIDAKTGAMDAKVCDMVCQWIPEFAMIEDLRFRGLFARPLGSGDHEVTFGTVSGRDVESLDADHHSNIFETLARLHEKYAKVDDDIDKVDERHDAKVDVVDADTDAVAKDSDEEVEDAGFVSGKAPMIKCEDSDDENDDDYTEEDD